MVVLAEGGEDIQVVVLAEGGEDIQVRAHWCFAYSQEIQSSG